MKRAKKKAITIRVPEELLWLAEEISHQQRTDRATTLRQWLYRGTEEQALDLVEEGRISRGQAQQMLDIDIYDFQALAQHYGKGLGGTVEQMLAARESFHRVFPLPEPKLPPERSHDN